jgi:polyketide cyclase/dehydrase/lipid transport protein
MISDQRLRPTTMSTPEPSVSVSRDFDAPAHELFRHLAQPADHAAIDGSGLVRGTDRQRPLSGVGDVFEMKMFNDTLGDYVTENHVVEFEADRRIAWEPVLKETDKPEHQSRIGDNAHLRWGWELMPKPGGGTRVTEFYDLSRAPEWLHEATKEGEVWRPAMEASLANLAKLIEETD